MSEPEVVFTNAPTMTSISNAWAVVLRHYQKETGSDTEPIPVLVEKVEKEKGAKKA